jgi:hypothetical protein
MYANAMRAGSPQKQIDGSFQILGHQCWPPGRTRLLARSVFSCPDENAHEAGGHRSDNVGLNIVADHHDILGGALKAFDGEFEKRRRRLAEDCCLSARSVFQSHNERAHVEAQFFVVRGIAFETD